MNDPTALKRICHITTVHRAEDIRIFIKECSSLAEFGYEVHLIAPADENYSKNGVQIHAIRTTSDHRLVRMIQRVQAVKSIVDAVAPDLVHLHDPELLRLVPRFKRYGMKIVYDAHEDAPRQIMSKYYILPILRRPIASIFQRFENAVTRKVDLVVGATPTISERFEAQGGKVVNVNNFPLTREFDHISFDPAKKERAVCYAGGISIIRGIREIVEIARRMPDVKVLVAGTFADHEGHKVMDQATDVPNFEFLGQLDREGVAALYERSIAGLSTLHPEPNHVFSLPIKMFEYMSAAVPVIASDFPLWQSIVEENNCGFCVDPMDVDAAVEKINYLLENPDIAAQLGHAGKDAAHNKYNWYIEAEKLRQAYAELFS